MASRSSLRGDRGQTLPDFAVGISIFLITLAFVIAFVPQLTVPYEGQASPIIADRAASDLAADLLTDAGTHARFDETCTLALFGYASDTGCGFDANASLHEHGGVPAHFTVNVTLRDGPSDDESSELLCADTDVEAIEPCGSERLARGPAVPSGTHAVASTRRASTVNGTPVVLEVRVW